MANRAEAQQLQNGSQIQQSYNWMNVEDAKGVCMEQINFWHTQVGLYAPGTSNYNNAVRHAAYFKGIFVSLSNGESTQQAITTALGAAATLGGEKEAGFTPKTVMRAIYGEALELLTI